MIKVCWAAALVFYLSAPPAPASQNPLSTPVDYFCNDSLRSGLKQKTVRGGMLTAAAQVARIGLMLATVPILTRLFGLDREDFGLVAMVTVLTNFAQMFVNAGLSTATVQREEITRQQVTNLFWAAAALGGAIGLGVAALAPVVSWFYDEPRLTPITIALGASFLVIGLRIQHQALLQRGMQFGRLALVTVLSQLLAQSAAVAWAWRYSGTPHDYWALVIMPLTAAATGTLLMWLACPWRPGLPRRGAGTRELVVFGANLTGFNFVNYFARNADNLLIGWWWGAASLGLYDRAYALLLFPVRQISPTLTGVVVPSLSRLTTKPDQYRSAYVAAVRALAWATIPVVGLLLAMSEPLVLLYLGPSFEPVVDLFRALAPAAWASSFISCAGWVYQSWGHVDRHFRWGIAHSLIIVAVIAACVPFGALAVAYGVSAAYVALRPVSFAICFAGTPIRLADLGGVIWRPTLLTLVAAAVGLAAAELVAPDAADQTATQLALALAGSAAAFIATGAALLLVVPGVLDDLKNLRRDLQTSRRPPAAPPATRESNAAAP